MKYRLVKIEELSGTRASIYTILCENKEITLFEEFLLAKNTLFKDEIYSILQRLRTIGTKTGAREHYFKI